MLSFEIVAITVVFLNRWRVESKLAWVLIGFGVLVYAGVIGAWFLN